jgi:hypothetical protein
MEKLKIWAQAKQSTPVLASLPTTETVGFDSRHQFCPKLSSRIRDRIRQKTTAELKAVNKS